MKLFHSSASASLDLWAVQVFAFLALQASATPFCTGSVYCGPTPQVSASHFFAQSVSSGFFNTGAGSGPAPLSDDRCAYYSGCSQPQGSKCYDWFAKNGDGNQIHITGWAKQGSGLSITYRTCSVTASGSLSSYTCTCGST